MPFREEGGKIWKLLLDTSVFLFSSEDRTCFPLNWYLAVDRRDAPTSVMSKYDSIPLIPVANDNLLCVVNFVLATSIVLHLTALKTP